MGIVKIYNVLGGFYENYNTTMATISVHKVAQISLNYLCKMRKRLQFLCLVVFQSIPRPLLRSATCID